MDELSILTVSGDDFSFPMVSGGDLPGSGSIVLIDMADTTSVLERIDNHLSIILGILLFFFCFKHIRMGIKGITGSSDD